MDSLKNLAFSDERTGVEKERYLKELLPVSLEQDSLDCYFRAIRSLSYYYWSSKEADSLSFYISIADSLAKQRSVVSPHLLDARNVLCSSYLENHEYEMAMNEAVNVLEQSEKTGYKLGVIASNESMGLIYLFIGRNKDAVPLLNKSLRLLEELDDQLFYKVYVMSYLQIAHFRLGEFDKMKELLDLYRSKMDRDFPEADFSKLTNAELGAWSFLYSNYINYYVGIGNKEEAKKYIEKASACVEKDPHPAYTSVYYLALSRYYLLTKEYDLALESINKVIAVDYSEDPLELKVSILSAAGKYDDFVAATKEYVTFLTKQNEEIYVRQVDQLRAFHDLNEREKQKQLLQLQEQQINQEQDQLLGFVIFVGILFLVLLGLFYYSYSVWKLKKDLEREKRFLKTISDNLLLAKDEAEVANLLRTKFMMSISHEVRTPLNAIVGFSALLDGLSEEEQEEFLRIINMNTGLLLSLVNDVLELSRIESNNFPFHMQEVNVDECCQKALEDTEFRLESGVELRFTPSDPPTLIWTDSTRLCRILVNVLSNAAKYTGQGHIALDYKLEEDVIRFTITDTGCGIPVDKHKIVFNSFEKVDEFKQGVGLGLTVCKMILSRLGGEIFIDPSYQDGARFIFTIPCRRQDVVA